MSFGDTNTMVLVSVRLAACGHAKLRSEHATPAPLPAACWQHVLRENSGDLGRDDCLLHGLGPVLPGLKV